MQDRIPESNPVQLLRTIYPSELLGSQKLFKDAIHVRDSVYYSLTTYYSMSLSNSVLYYTVWVDERHHMMFCATDHCKYLQVLIMVASNNYGSYVKAVQAKTE